MDITNEPYIVMYDVRGIQDYIFKTNYAKEIVGASYIVDSIIIDGLREYIESLEQVSRTNICWIGRMMMRQHFLITEKYLCRSCS